MRHVKKSLIWALGAYVLSYCQVDTNSDRFYLMTYFLNSSQDAGGRLALSSDGLKWQKYNNEASVITPTVGSSLMRDPMIYFDKATALFHMVWTTGWSDKVIGYASSSDLKTWNKQATIGVGAKITSCACCWAPEIFYDDIKDSCMIFWSTENSTAGKRTYYVMTKDFKTFTDPVKFFDPGYTEIDASMLKAAQGKYYLFFKDERESGKNIHYVYGSTPQGPWSVVSGAITSAGCEGPSAVKIGAEYRVYFDPYSNSDKTYRMVKTAGLDNSASPWPNGGTINAGTSNFAYSHGSIIEIPRAYVMHLLYNRSLPTYVAFQWPHLQKAAFAMKGPLLPCLMSSEDASCRQRPAMTHS
jgi:sucrose-6-phosphate hydrolase SacC (GH32 family)